MKTELQLGITFDQLLSMVKRLTTKEKIKLTKAMEKDVIENKLNRLLKTFKTDKLNLKTINDEVEMVRQEIYDKQKR